MMAVKSMDKRNKLHQMRDLLDDEILLLRQHLIDMGAWPAAGDDFLALMPLSRWESPAITERDAQWLPTVIAAARSGCDIGATYPSFFQKLLTNSQLRRQFLQVLATIEH